MIFLRMVLDLALLFSSETTWMPPFFYSLSVMMILLPSRTNSLALFSFLQPSCSSLFCFKSLMLDLSSECLTAFSSLFRDSDMPLCDL